MDDCVYTNLCWSLDDAMVESLDPEYIRGYFCYNLIGEPGGNCFNLVSMPTFVMISYYLIKILPENSCIFRLYSKRDTMLPHSVML